MQQQQIVTTTSEKQGNVQPEIQKKDQAIDNQENMNILSPSTHIGVQTLIKTRSQSRVNMNADVVNIIDNQGDAFYNSSSVNGSNPSNQNHDRAQQNKLIQNEQMLLFEKNKLFKMKNQQQFHTVDDNEEVPSSLGVNVKVRMLPFNDSRNTKKQIQSQLKAGFKKNNGVASTRNALKYRSNVVTPQNLQNTEGSRTTSPMFKKLQQMDFRSNFDQASQQQPGVKKMSILKLQLDSRASSRSKSKTSVNRWQSVNPAADRQKHGKKKVQVKGRGYIDKMDLGGSFHHQKSAAESFKRRTISIGMDQKPHIPFNMQNGVFFPSQDPQSNSNSGKILEIQEILEKHTPKLSSKKRAEPQVIQDNLHDQLEQRSSGTYNLSYRENQTTTFQGQKNGGEQAVHPNLEDHLQQMQMNKLKPIQLQQQNRRAQTQVNKVRPNKKADINNNNKNAVSKMLTQQAPYDESNKRQSPKSGFAFQPGVKTDPHIDLHDQVPTSLTTNSINYLSTAFQKPHLKPIHQHGPQPSIVHSEIEDCESPTQEEETLVVNTERNSKEKEIVKDSDYEVLFKNALQNQIQEVDRRSSRLQHNRPNNIDETQPSFLFGWQQNAQQYIEQSAPNKHHYPGAEGKQHMMYDPRAMGQHYALAAKQTKVNYKFDHFRVTGADSSAESKSTRQRNRRHIKALEYMKLQQEVEHYRIQGSPQEGRGALNSGAEIIDDNNDHASTLRRQQKRFSQTGNTGIQRIHYELTYDRSKSTTAEHKRTKTREQSSFMNKIQSLRHGRPDVRSSQARRAGQKHTGDNPAERNRDLAQIASNPRLSNAANSNRSNNQYQKGSNRTPRQIQCVTKQVSTLNNSESPDFKQLKPQAVYQGKAGPSPAFQTPNSRNLEEVERDVCSTLKKREGSIQYGEAEPRLAQYSKITEMPRDEGGSVVLGETPEATEGDYRYDKEIDLLRKDSQLPAGTKGNSERHSQDDMLNSDIPKGAILQSRRPTLEIEGTPPHEGLVAVEQLLGPAPFPACLMSQTPESSHVMKTAQGNGPADDTILSSSTGLRGEPHVKSSRLDNIIRDSINQKMPPSSRMPLSTQSNLISNTPADSNRQKIVLAKPAQNNESIQNLATDLKIEGKYHVAGSQFQQDGTLVVRINSQEEGSERQKQFQTLQQDYAANQSQSSPLNRQIYGDAQRAQYTSQPMHPSYLSGNAIHFNVRQQYGYGPENDQQLYQSDEPAEDLHFTLCNQVVKRRKQMVHYNQKHLTLKPTTAPEEERPQLQFKGKQHEILNIRTTGNVNLNPIQKNLNKKRAKTPQMAKFMQGDQIDQHDLHYQFLQNFESKKDAYLQNYYQSQKRVQLRNHLMLLRQRALESQHQKTQEQYLQSLAEAIASTNENSSAIHGPSRVVHKAQTPVTLAYNSAVNIKNFEEVERLQKTLKMDVKSSPKAYQSHSLVPINININKARGSTPSGPVHVPQYDRKQTNFDRLYNNRLIQESQRASNASSTIQHENDDKDLEQNLQINSKNFIHSTRDGRSRDYGSGMEQPHKHYQTQNTAETKGSARFSMLNPSQLSKRSKPSQNTGRSNDEKDRSGQKIPVIGLNLGETSNKFEVGKNPNGGVDTAELKRRIAMQQESSIHIPDVAQNIIQQSPTLESVKQPSQIRMSPELEQKLLNHLSSAGIDGDTKQTIILVDQDFNVINDQDLQINHIQFMNPQFQGMEGIKVYENLDYIQQHHDQLQTIQGSSNVQTRQCISPPIVNGGGGTREPTVGGVSSFISVKSIKTIKSASGMDSVKLGVKKIQTRSQQSANSRAHSGSASTIGDASNIQKMGMRNAPGVFQGSEHSLNFLGSKSKLKSPSQQNDYKIDSSPTHIRRPETQGAERKDNKKGRKNIVNREENKSVEDESQVKNGLTIDIHNADHPAFINQQSQGIESYGKSNGTTSGYHHNGREVKIRHIQLQKFPKNSQVYDRQGSVKSQVNRILAAELPPEQIFFADNTNSKEENQLTLPEQQKKINPKEKFESARPQYTGQPATEPHSRNRMRAATHQMPPFRATSENQPFEVVGVTMGSNQMEAQQMLKGKQSSGIALAFENNVRIATKSTPKNQNGHDSVGLINGNIAHQNQMANLLKNKGGTYRQKRATSQHSRTRSLKSKISAGMFGVPANAGHMSQVPTNPITSPPEQGPNTLDDKWQHKNQLMQQLNDIHMNMVPAESRDRQQRVYRQQIDAHEKINYQKYLQKVGLTEHSQKPKCDAAISGEQFKYDPKMSKEQPISDGSNSMAGARIIQPLLDQKIDWIINNQNDQSPKTQDQRSLALTMQQTTYDNARQKMMFETNAGSQFNKYSTLEGPSQERARENTVNSCSSPNRQNEIIEETKVACSSRQDNIVDSYVQQNYDDIDKSLFAKMNQNREYQRSLRQQINELKGQQPLQAQIYQFPNRRDTESAAMASALAQRQDQSKSPKRHQRSFRKRSTCNHQSNSRSPSKARKDYQISKSPKLCGENLNQNREYIKNKDGQMILIPQLPVKALVVVGKQKRGSKISQIIGTQKLSPKLTTKQSRADSTQSPRRTTENDDLQIVQIINPAHLKTCQSPASGQTGTLHMNSQKMSIQNIQNQTGKKPVEGQEAGGLNIEPSYFPVLQLRNGQIVSGEIRSGHLSQQMIIEQAIKQSQNVGAANNNNLGPLIHIQTLNLESLDSVSPKGQTGRSTLRPVSDSRNLYNGRMHSNSRKNAKAGTQVQQIRFSHDKTSKYERNSTKSGRSSPNKSLKQQTITTAFLTKPEKAQQVKTKINKFHGGVDLSKEQKIVQDVNSYSPPMLQDPESQPETPRTYTDAASPQVQTTQARMRQRNSSDKE